jgi:isoleucyl-tRNA synthetase
VSLFPFMSILACLVGTIVVMICVLSLIQAQHMGGRPPQEVRDATDYVKATEEVARIEEELEQLEEQRTQGTADAATVVQEDRELDERMVQLRMQAEAAKAGEQTSRDLQRELELAILQLSQMAKEKPAYAREIEEIKQELASRQKSPDQLAAPIVVKPGGTGRAAGRNLFFVEAASGALTLFVSKSEKSRITAGSVGKDVEYDAFLERVAKTQGSTLVFLVRDDGWDAYTRGAGWAEGKFGIRTGKLPMPGKGPIDLSNFEEFMAP